MTSKLSIANQALIKVGRSAQTGSTLLTSLNDGTTTAILINTVIDRVIKQVMTDGAFTSTIRRAELNRTTNTPAFQYAYEFQLPTSPKCLRVLELDNTSTQLYRESSKDSIDYVIEGDKLLTDQSSVKVKYIAYITTENDYDPMLETCIVNKLAAEIAYDLSGSSTLAERLQLNYERELANCKSVDGQNGNPKEISGNSLTDVR